MDDQNRRIFKNRYLIGYHSDDEFIEEQFPEVESDSRIIDSLSRKKEVSTSDKTDVEQFEKGKAFGTYYECYM